MADYRLGELFCGPGGMGLGATVARGQGGSRIRHLWATDYDPSACATYALNLGSRETVICEDIRTLEWSRLCEIGKPDALAFGFPCNDFSLVGKQKGITGSFGPLYTYCVAAVKHFRPKWFLAENVGGLKSSGGGQALQQILEQFSKLGYDLYPHYYRFEEYGVPQARHRILIAGFQRELDVQFRIPSPARFAEVNNSARAALEQPPIPQTAPNQEPTRQSEGVVRRLRLIRPGQNAFNSELPPSLQLQVKGAKISQIYRRLHPDRPAYTITGSGGGGTHVYHWREPRALTNRERARLQTFPDDFEFVGSKEAVRRQIGMAVPPIGVKVIFDAILDTLDGQDYEAVKQNMEFKHD